MKKFRTWLVTLILLAVTIRVLWWAFEPLIPFLIVALALVCIFGTIIYRSPRW